MTAFDQRPRGALSSITRIRSLIFRFQRRQSHFCLTWSVGRYSRNHRLQNISARSYACFHSLFLEILASLGSPGRKYTFGRSSRSLLGVRCSGSLESLFGGVRGRSLRIFSTSAIRVRRVSSLTVWPPRSEGSMFRMERTVLSHIPPPPPPWRGSPEVY